MAHKQERKELKKPDEFQVVAGKTMDFLLAHRVQVLVGLAAVAVVAVVVWSMTTWNASREAKAGAALAQALELEQRPIAAEGNPQAGDKTFPTRADRDKAVLDALEQVRKEYSKTRAGQTATAQVGFQKLRAGDATGAQAALDEFLNSAGKDHPLRAFVTEALGYAYEAQGKLEEAKKAFARLREADAPERAAFHEARLALVENKPDAKQQLEKVAKEYPKDPVALEANQRLEIAALPPPPTPAEESKPAEQAKPAQRPKKPVRKK
ncbi:MAG: tetratricopeptide repeat protein [Myxococcales bacterium]